MRGQKARGAVFMQDDPRIHDELPRAKSLRRLRVLNVIMDCRVKPGNDKSAQTKRPGARPGRSTGLFCGLG
jgi:hypothetical protein